jgi:hypothetical protein
MRVIDLEPIAALQEEGLALIVDLDVRVAVNLRPLEHEAPTSSSIRPRSI